MSEAFLHNPALPAFLLASLVLAATPGPGVIYILARTLEQGRRAGLSSVAGVASGNLVNAIGAAIGLAALLTLSSLAFAVIQYAGALYLFYLGVKTLATAPPSTPGDAFGKAALAAIFRDGFMVAVLNPKTALFFAAFLPQFIHPAAPAMLQSMLFGVLFVLIALVTDSIYVLTASAASPALSRLHKAPRFARYLSAAVLIGLAVLAATSASSRSR
ncbi:MAG: LysE family translocator [Candidatus Accumulibacter phosphatis]|jgi:threonine/homoserine/homoserine lactone efflux protein|uniref:LysE family translocator n=1 Tax=Candidatus Accumulibacter contiguus TaxID=2954381 RepID=A0ABX1T3H5_9PROT|nr:MULTISPECIES: LysE family translocator [Candidatus Accumulibacter]MBL8408304.1 LysE family translocator [Accumulibacter sp.]NMQ04193.1 LysE family translocator [Candidatus Accumulibacter contiguus]